MGREGARVRESTVAVLNLQGLSIGCKAREPEKELVVNLVDSLEIGGNGLELNPESPIASDGEAILPHHRDQGTSIVLEDLKRPTVKEIGQVRKHMGIAKRDA